MPCYKPIDAWPAAPDAPDRRLVFSSFRSYQGARALSVGCGKCIGCQLDRARQWATRIMHEAKSSGFGRSHFVTLTFSGPSLLAAEEAEPSRPRNSLWKPDVQRVMMRLRNRVGAGVKSFTGAEYGERNLRPHYHLCLLHLDLFDLVPWRKASSGAVLYRSRLLEDVWPFGHVEVGTLTPASAEYTARYALKKVPAAQRADRYSRSDPETGEVWQVVPEFALMSRGIGASWLEQFSGDLQGGFVLNSERNKVPIPRYYRERLSRLAQLKLKAQGMAQAKAHAADLQWERLAVREEVRHLKADRLARALDAAELVDAEFAHGNLERFSNEAALGLLTADQRDAQARLLLSDARRGRRRRDVPGILPGAGEELLP